MTTAKSDEPVNQLGEKHEMLARLIDAIERLDRSAAVVRKVVFEIRGLLPREGKREP